MSGMHVHAAQIPDAIAQMKHWVKARSSPLHNRLLECMASWRRARTHISEGSAADLVLPDGMPLVRLARWNGDALAHCVYRVDGDVRRPYGSPLQILLPGRESRPGRALGRAEHLRTRTLDVRISGSTQSTGDGRCRFGISISFRGLFMSCFPSTAAGGHCLHSAEHGQELVVPQLVQVAASMKIYAAVP